MNVDNNLIWTYCRQHILFVCTVFAPAAILILRVKQLSEGKFPTPIIECLLNYFLAVFSLIRKLTDNFRLNWCSFNGRSSPWSARNFLCSGKIMFCLSPNWKLIRFCYSKSLKSSVLFNKKLGRTWSQASSCLSNHNWKMCMCILLVTLMGYFCFCRYEP